MAQGKDWHIELFRRFRPPATGSLPVLLPSDLAERMKPFRGFRHVVRHGYTLDLEWERMQMGLEEARPVFEQFQEHVELFLSDLQDAHE